MQNRMRRLSAMVLLLLFVCGGVAAAAPPYYGYVYDDRRNEVMGPAPYVPEEAWHQFGPAGRLREPEHLFIDAKGRLWVSDKANDRLLVLTADGHLIRVIAPEGQGKLNQPHGIYVTPDYHVLVADYGNGRVLRFDEEGNLLREYPRPESPLLGEGYTYAPIRVVEDRRGYLYVLNKGSSIGLMQLDPDGVFRGFFGANRLQFSWGRLLRRLLFTREQQERTVEEKPPVYTDLFIDEYGFIYTVTAESVENQVKKLSPVGVDVLNRPTEWAPQFYGEFTFVIHWGWPRRHNPNFTGLTVDRRGVITVVDANTGRAYQYDQNRRLLFTWGGKGNQMGTFGAPNAVAVGPDGRIYIVDTPRNMIQVFRPTAFALLVHHAIELYNDGKYEEAVGPWREVLRLNARYDLAHAGLGKAMLRAEDYRGAMREFRYARDRQGWSEAFGEWRRVTVRDHFAWVAWGFIALLGAAVWAARRLVRWMRLPKPWEVEKAA
jgi:DNA-binding beta-propeller fold protein YncE